MIDPTMPVVPRSAVVTETIAARTCGISVVHLRRLRKAGKGPRHVMLGERRIGYKVAEIEAWLESRTVGTPPGPAALPSGNAAGPAGRRRAA